MFSLARHHGQLGLYDEALEKNWDLEAFRVELRQRIRTPDVPLQTRSASGGGGSLFDALERDQRWLDFKKGVGQQRGCKLELPWSPFQTRATLLTSTGVTGYDRPPGITLLEQQPLTVAALFRSVPTSQPTIRVTQEASYTQAATAVSEEGLKPEASFDLVETDFTVRKIAVVGRASDEMFADFPSVRDYVNGRLVWMVQSKIDSELLNGSGTPPRITGVLQTAGIGALSAGASPTVFDAIAKAVSNVWQNSRLRPDAIVMHPADFTNLRLSKDGEGQYYLGGPGDSLAIQVDGMTAVGRLWALPIAITSSITQGTALVGAFKTAGFIAERLGLTLEATNSDASDFVYNRICIRAETRLALVIDRPTGFCTVTGIPA